MKTKILYIFLLSVVGLFMPLQGQKKVSRLVNYCIGQYEIFHSKVLNEERTILVHLPDDYKSSSKKYPVLYVLDAEDTQRYIQGIMAITYYSGARRLPKMIVVGILNTNRTRDITPKKVLQYENSGSGDTFLKFIVTELCPHIDSNYRSERYRILFGGSSAGMFTLYTLFNTPESFNVYIASRPALNSIIDYSWDSDVIFRKVIKLFADRSSLKRTLYVDYGSQDKALHEPAPILKLADILKSKAPEDFHWKIREMGESGYRSAVSLIDGLHFVFADWYFSSDSLFTKGIVCIKVHAKNLSGQLNYDIGLEDILDERDLNKFGYRLMENENLKEAIVFFKYAVKYYPESWNALDSLAEAFLKNGQKNLAIKYYQRSLKLNPDNQNAIKILKKAGY